jgi:2-C-methyl-D-erythritol 4-phosphate cytidylyltransferase
MSSYAAIIPAAGSGSRMGASVPKVLLSLSPEGPSILTQTVTCFEQDPACVRIVLCVPADWHGRFAQEVQGCAKVQIVLGGSSRQESVSKGVAALAASLDVNEEEFSVLVHDAARACISHEVIARVREGVARHGAVTAAVPVVDSLCRAEDGVIAHHVDRSHLWAVQTPQGFLLKDLVAAHRDAAEQGIEAFDDAALVARLRPVHVVEGDRFNIKVTQPGDLAIAEMISNKREG